MFKKHVNHVIIFWGINISGRDGGHGGPVVSALGSSSSSLGVSPMWSWARMGTGEFSAGGRVNLERTNVPLNKEY